MPPFQKTLEGDIIVDTNHRGHASPWNAAQSAVLATSLPVWVKFAFVENRSLDGRDPKLTKWKQDEADRLLKLPEFHILPDGMSVAKARDSIVRKFTNYRSRHLKVEAPSEDKQNEIESRKIAASALVDWKTLSSGRALFKQRNYSAIITQREELIKEDPDLSQVGAFQKAYRELWQMADQEYYERMASEVKDLSIFENQKLFPEYLWESLSGLCQSGGLGNTVMLTLYAFRDENGIIASGVVEAHHERKVNAFRNYAGELFPSIRSTFEEWANATLPQTKPPKTSATTNFAMPKNQDGLPLFPTFNLDQVTTEILRQVICAYFHNVWAFCRPDEEKVPWEDIAAFPAKYYDTSLHSFKVSLPTQLDTLAIHKLAQVLMQLSSTNAVIPFRFRSSSEVANESRAPLSTSIDDLPGAATAHPLSLSLSHNTDDHQIPQPNTSPEAQTASHDTSLSRPSNASSPRARHSPAAGVRFPSPSSPSHLGVESQSFHHSSIPSNTQSRISTPSQPRSHSAHINSANRTLSRSQSSLSAAIPASTTSDGDGGAGGSLNAHDTSLQLLADASLAVAKPPDTENGPVGSKSSPQAPEDKTGSEPGVGSGLAATQGRSSGGEGACGTGIGDAGNASFEGATVDEVARVGCAVDAMDGGVFGGMTDDGNGGAVTDRGAGKDCGGVGIESSLGEVTGEVTGETVGGKVKGRRPTTAKGKRGGGGSRRKNSGQPPPPEAPIPTETPMNVAQRISTRLQGDHQPKHPEMLKSNSIIIDFLRDSRKRSLSFTLQDGGRPGKVRKVSSYEGAYLHMDGEDRETWFDQRDVGILTMLEDIVVD